MAIHDAIYGGPLWRLVLEILIVVTVGVFLAGLSLGLGLKEFPLVAIRSIDAVPGGAWRDIEAVRGGAVL